jgi:hypothetical protein
MSDWILFDLCSSSHRAEELLRDCYDNGERCIGLSEREKRQAVLPIQVFSIHLVSLTFTYCMFGITLVFFFNIIE